MQIFSNNFKKCQTPTEPIKLGTLKLLSKLCLDASQEGAEAPASGRSLARAWPELGWSQRKKCKKGLAGAGNDRSQDRWEGG